MSDLITFKSGRAVFRVKPETYTALLNFKPRKRRLAVERRRFPVFYAGQTSTADYVARYFDLNSDGKGYGLRYVDRINAYDTQEYADHLALYQPLNTAPAAVYQDMDWIEADELEVAA